MPPLTVATTVLFHWALLLLADGAVASPVTNGQQQVLDLGAQDELSQPPSSPKLHGKFLHITDFHIDEFYKVHSSTEEDDACHKGSGAAGTYGAETSDCDTPHALLNATFDWIAANIRDDIDFIIWTGDSARHDSDESVPRSPGQVIASNRLVASKFVETFPNAADPSLPSIPVIPTLGNNDFLPHNILLPGPNKWLQYYTSIWEPFIPEEQRHSFQFGGWFYVEVIPNRLAVFSLNSMYFFDRNAGVDDCQQPSEPGFKQMEWLRIQLELFRTRGVKAILMGHVPPARTDSKKLWDETCWSKYNLWLRQYRDVIVASLYGHMNLDHFILHDTRLSDPEFANVDEEAEDGDDDDDAESDVLETTEDDELTTLASSSYLVELRTWWAGLPNSVSRIGTSGAVSDEGKKKKPKKKKKNLKAIGGKWAERYHLSHIGPSIVPNYFPSLRVFEYNISGMEDAPTWAPPSTGRIPSSLNITDIDQALAVEVEISTAVAAMGKKGKGKKGKGKKGKKGKKPHDPNLVVPEPPTKGSPPGPAYSMQPLSLLGYTQYFANLTYLNNDVTHDESDEVDGGENTEADFVVDKWREGMHRDKKPKHTPKPRPFEFLVEYSTFNDPIYKLKDLTVRSYLHLAWRIGQDPNGNARQTMDENDAIDNTNDDPADLEPEDPEEEFNDPETEEDDIEYVSDTETEDTALGGKKGKKGKNGKKKTKKRNKVWLHFLKYAFVSSADEKTLDKIAT